jgi:ATP-binding cassette subfamily B protein
MWDGVSGRIQDALGAVKTVKLSGAEARESEALRQSSESAYATYVQRNWLANRFLFWQTSLSYISHALVLGYGGWLVYQHQLTPGDIVMFVAYLDRLYTPIESLTGLAVSLQERFASFRRAAGLLAEPGAEMPGGPLPPGPGCVEFINVSFAHVANRPVLQAVSMRFEAGKVTALVGPSGAGKTTASDLLLRLFEPDAGEIRIDGVPIAGVDAATIRREVGVVAADGAIFSGSLADNIRYKRPEATDAEVLQAARECGLTPLLERLPEGLMTEVGERGTGLSLGERQRLQIARALIARPRVLVLDEATANLDYATESEIRASLLDRKDRPTTIIIAHRYSMVEFAAHVIVMEAGRIVDEGSPAALMTRGGWFARFAAAAGHLPEPGAHVPDEEEADD